MNFRKAKHQALYVGIRRNSSTSETQWVGCGASGITSPPSVFVKAHLFIPECFFDVSTVADDVEVI